MKKESDICDSLAFVWSATVVPLHWHSLPPGLAHTKLGTVGYLMKYIPLCSLLHSGPTQPWVHVQAVKSTSTYNVPPLQSAEPDVLAVEGVSSAFAARRPPPPPLRRARARARAPSNESQRLHPVIEAHLYQFEQHFQYVTVSKLIPNYGIQVQVKVNFKLKF